MEPTNICPYPGCDSFPGAAALRCPECQRKLQICPACSATNRVMATYCRKCGKQLPLADELRIPRGTPEQTSFVGSAICLPNIGTEAALPRHRSLECAVDAPVVAAYDLLFVPTKQNGLQALRLGDLSTAFTLPSSTGAPLLIAPTIAGGKLYLPNPLALDLYDLKPLSSDDSEPPQLLNTPVRLEGRGEHIITPILPFGDVVIFSTDQAVYKLDKGGRSMALLRGRSDAVTRRGNLVICCPDDEAVAGVDLMGNEAWRQTLREAGNTTRRINSTPGIMSLDDRLVFSDARGAIWIMYPEKGGYLPLMDQWTSRMSGLGVLRTGGIVIGSGSGLIAVDLGGRRLWTVDEQITSSLIVTQHLVVAGTDSGGLLLVDSATGARKLLGVGHSAVRGVAVSGSTVVAVTADGVIAAYDLPLQKGT